LRVVDKRTKPLAQLGQIIVYPDWTKTELTI